ncbi:MAG: hypothetical protein AAF704_10630, partial [Cyanobacteria bacterium P01_D01_bin.123]
VKLSQQESALESDRQYLQTLTEYFQRQDICEQQAMSLVSTHDFIVASGAATTPTLSIEELTATVQQLRQRYEQYAGQVQQQEQELVQNQSTLAELQQKLEAASPDDRFDIEMDIDYAKDACKALEEALMPQRQRLAQLQQELEQQDSSLKRRTGDGGPTIPTVDMGSLVAPIKDQKLALQAELDRLSARVQEQETSIVQLQESITTIQQEGDAAGSQLEAEEQSLHERTQSMAETWGGLNHRREWLQTERDWLQSLQQSADNLAGAVADLNGKSENGRAQLAQALELISSWS